MVGWLLTNWVNGLLAINIRLIAITTAAIMTSKWSTIPTAVITESSEKMASSTTICVTTPQNFAPLRCVGLLLSFPSSRSFSSIVALNNRKKPPNSMIKSRALKVNERKLNSGCVRVTSQEIDASSNRRINIASSSPVTRARSRCFGGSFSARKKKEEVYESKLRFFTNITHEFCTPLTLIYGPCEKILAYPQSDSYIRKYGKMIQQNTEKLNGLILELLEFRRLETGHKVLSIQRLSVSDKLQNIAESFCELAENKNLNYRLDIEPDIEWNTYISCFSKIVNNLISNAFKYTPEEGNITIGLKVENQFLTLNISNSGKGIAKENLAKIFDRYKILDSFEMNGKNSRNGLGLAICKNMVTLLNGEINVSSIQNEITTFTVTLPELSPTAQEAETPQKVYATGPLNTNTEPMELEQTTVNFDTSKHTVMIIDDDPSMLWFVSEIFVDKYNVLSFNNAAEALASLELKQPDLIISDVMMPEIDGLSFAQKIKQNKLWSHIPLILLSALHHEDDQVKGIEAGAEVYVTKPFNVKYLEKVVYRLIKRESDLKEYYSSIFSSFKVENGNCIHKEDQEFLDKVIETIEKNITNPDLSVELLSSDLGYSTRQFYRKLKPITDKSPADIIKEYRLTMAERLLLTKNYTIEEIMDKTGFNNRGTFYKLFSQRFGMPPRQYREQQKDSVKKELKDMESINE